MGGHAAAALSQPLVFEWLLRRFEAVQQFGVRGEPLEHFENLSRAEAGTRQTAIGRGQVLLLAEEAFPFRQPVFAADPLFDERLFVNALIDLPDRALGQLGGDAMLAQVVNYPRAAAFFGGEARAGEAFRVPAIVQIPGPLETGQHLVDIARPLGAAAQFLAQFAGGLGSSRQAL